MTTQGISLAAAKLSEKTAARGSKAGETGFDSIMTDRASKTAPQKDSRQDRPDKAADTVTADRSENAVPVKKESAVQTKNPQVKDSAVRPQDPIEDSVDPEAAACQMAAMFYEVFGVDIETLLDTMKQTGRSMMEVLGSFSNENAAQAFQNLVMEMHGITDKAAFLTNDKLVQELSALNERFVQILSEALKIPVEKLADADPSILASLAEKVDDALQLMVQPELTEDAGNGQEQMPGMMAENPEQGFEVIIEEPQTSNGNAQTETFAKRQGPEPAVQNENAAANLFTERLTEAFESSAVEDKPSAGQLMTRIVEQVVEQVKIRVMPETTSMELMLHPESLGRVNIQVSAAAGVAKATLIVENLMAKEALESQLITLKETFAEQGLKVEAVEVTVSEFGLNQENHQAQQEQQNGAKRRRFRSGDSMDDGVSEGTETESTAAERRDINSVVDYTA